MRILNLDNWCEEAKESLNEFEFTHEGMNTYESEGIIANLKYKFDEKVLRGYPNLKFIASCTTGLDHIDTDYCEAKGIDIISLKGETDLLRDVWATAEHTWALIMSLVRKVPFAFDDVKRGNWDREAWQGTELRGKTLGVVGYGRVGRQVARFAEAFGMYIMIYVPNHPLGESYLDTVLRRSDIVTVHVPLNTETTGMFGEEQFKRMKPTAYFINTSRGAVVDEAYLWRALKDKWIAGAALDVLENEPNINPSLIEYAKQNTNLVLTCHIAGNTAESRKKTQLHIANKIKECVNGL